MNIEPKTIHDISTEFLKTGHNDIFQGHWVTVSFEEWKTHLKKKALDNKLITSVSCLKLEFLDFVIEKIKHNRYGASCDYELFEQRRQEEIELFLSDFTLTAEESAYFKERVGFIEDFSPYATFCSDCDGEVSAFASAKSLQMEGVELCSHCLNSRYC